MEQIGEGATVSRKAYEVEWVDISGASNWVSKDIAANLTPIRCHTVGYIAKRTKRLLVVYSTGTDNNSVSDRTAIPMSNVKRIKRLR